MVDVGARELTAEDGGKVEANVAVCSTAAAAALVNTGTETLLVLGGLLEVLQSSSEESSEARGGSPLLNRDCPTTTVGECSRDLGTSNGHLVNWVNPMTRGIVGRG